MKHALLKILGILFTLCVAIMAIFAITVYRETNNLNAGKMLDRAYIMSDEDVSAAQISF